MKIGAMNHPLKDLIKEIKWISENGFDFIDLTIEPIRAYNIDIKKTKDALDKFSLEAIGHTNPFLPAIFPIDSIKEACLKEFRRYITVFSEIGIKLMNIHPFYRAPFYSDEMKIRANIEFIKEVNRMCSAEGIILMLENYITPFDRPEVFSMIINEVPDLMVHLDVAHCNINQIENLTAEFFRQLGDRIMHLHLSDNRGREDEHLPLGCGNIKWAEIIKVIKGSGYNRTITLEVFSHDRDYLLISRDKLKKWLEY
jgi:sugar phosphate isomerase/epimerase